MKKKWFSIQGMWLILKEAATSWWAKDPFRESATIAYYAIFSIPGLLTIVVAIAAFFFGQEAVNGQISEQVSAAMSQEAAKQMEEIIAASSEAKKSVIASIIGVITILFGATGVLVQFQKSLNNIWEVKVDPEKKQWLHTVKSRLFSLGIIISLGFLMLISMMITTVISALSSWIQQRFPDAITYLVEGLNIILSLGIITILFSLMFRVLPDAKIKWKHVMAGGFVTALLFTLGKFALGFYFGKSDPASAYGAAGSVVLILLWVSYSSMIVFFGAEFTKAFVIYTGSKVVPKKNAVYVPGLNDAVLKANNSNATNGTHAVKKKLAPLTKELSSNGNAHFDSSGHAHRKWFRLLFFLWPLLSLVSKVLPFLLKYIVNRTLKKRGAGQVRSISFSLVHPSCVIKGFHFEKVNIWEEETFDCAAGLLKLSFSWRGLWKGMLVCNATARDLDFSFIKSKNDESGDGDQRTLSERFLLPFTLYVNDFTVTNGKVRFTDTTHSPAVKVEMDNIRVDMSGLSSIPSEERLPARGTIRALVYDGVLTIHLKADLFETTPTFDIDAEVIGMDMTKMNAFFEAYGKFDVNRGTLGLFAEVAAKDGKYKGYVKPVIRNLDVVGLEDKNESLLNKVWESAVGTVASLIKNQQEDQLATKIPVEGSFKPDVDVVYAMIETLVNAFIQALKPSIDYEINISSVEEGGART